jgi:hypothetical protein
MRNHIDLEPDYQRRGEIWPLSKRALLIDSILNGLDIPKFYLADFALDNTTLNTKRKRYAVIDGKQRLLAIFAFIDDKLVLDDDCVLKEAKASLKGLNYSGLKAKYPRAAERFEQFRPMVMSVVSDDTERIEELFVRLNLAVPPNGAEVRNAMPGIIPKLIRRIADHPFFTECIRFSVNRYEDRNTAAKLLLIEDRGGPQSLKKADLDKFAKGAAKPSPKDKTYVAAAARVEAVLDRMVDCFQKRDLLLDAAGRVPVYYWVVRGLGQRRPRDLRNRFLEFERTVKENRDLVKAGHEPADAELLEFSRWRWSPNDEAAVKSMCQLMSEHMGLTTDSK